MEKSNREKALESLDFRDASGAPFPDTRINAIVYAILALADAVEKQTYLQEQMWKVSRGE